MSATLGQAPPQHSRPQEGLFLQRTVQLERVVSTMAEVRALAYAGAPHGTTVVALQQTGGRGRHGRSWVSAPGAGLWLTTLLVPPLGADLRGLTLCLGGGVLRAIHALGAPEARIKWPNDIVVGERKLAGVLTEQLPQNPAHLAERPQTCATARLLVGVGVNLAAAAPKELHTLDAQAAKNYQGLQMLRPEVTLHDAQTAVMNALELAYDTWCLEGMGPTLDLFAKAHALQGAQVRAHNGDGRDTVGTVTGIAADGGLTLLCDGKPTTIYAGEVTRVRALTL